MTKISIIMIYLIGIYLLIILLIFIFQRSLLYFPSKEKINTSYYSNSGLKEVEFTTSDGLVLKSLFKKPFTDEKNILYEDDKGAIYISADKKGIYRVEFADFR